MDINVSTPTITTHTFQDILLDSPVTFHLMKMQNCLFVWVGDQGNFEHLAVAMTTPYSSVPTASNLLGYSVDDLSCSLATKLSKKIGKQVFASCNISKSGSTVLISITQRLMKELAQYPEKF